MSQSEFYSTNLFRAYPFFTDDEVTFGLIADAKIIVRPTIDYEPGRNRMEMTSYGRITSLQGAILGMPSGPFVAFAVRGENPIDMLLVAPFGNKESFTDVAMRLVVASQFDAIMIGARTTILSLVSTKDLSGWCVMGDADTYPASYVKASIPLEPGVVFATPEFAAGVGQTFVFNKRTTQYVPPIGCEHIDPSVYVGDEYQQICAIDSLSVKIAGGSQVRVNQRRDLQQIELTADRTAGEGGKLCVPIELADGQADTDSAPTCTDVLRSINGIGGPIANIAGLRGVSVQQHPDLNRVVINIGTKDLEVCVTGGAVDEQVEYLPTDDNDRLCGNNNTEPLQPGEPDGSTGYSLIIGPAVTPSPQLTARANQCLWAADGDDWALTNYPCKSPRSCMPPSRVPTSSNEVTFTPCLLVQLGEGEMIRNADFTNEHVPLAGWDVDTGVQVVNAFGDLPTSQFPMAKIVTQDRSRVQLSQAGIIALEGLYVFQVELFLPTGSVSFMLTDQVTGLPQISFHHTTTSSQVQRLVFGPFRIDAAALSLSVEYDDVPGQTALVGFFALVSQ